MMTKEEDKSFISEEKFIMKNISILSLILTVSLLHAIARENIREGEQSGIPDRADVQKEVIEEGKTKGEEDKKEVRENQEHTDPVFYDSTTSPKEMEENKDG